MSSILVTAPLSVRWGDMDAYGHVNNSVYATYLEEARIRWFANMKNAWMTDEAAPVVASSTIEFRRPIGYPTDLLIELSLDRMGTSSLTIGFKMRDRDTPETLYAEGNTVMVWINRNTGKSTPLPDALRKICEDSV